MNLDKMIEVYPLEDTKIIRETLTRIGIVDKKRKIVYPSCYLYEKFGKFYIVHFKELFLLNRDSGYNNMSEDDNTRKKSIVWCLRNWNLLDCEDVDIEPHNTFISVVPFKDKGQYEIKHKFNRYEIEGSL